MSLDVYLSIPYAPSVADGRILIRRDGATTEITRDEWDEMYPDREPVVAVALDEDEIGSGEVYWANITHNLGRMADQCGLYDPLWRAEDLGLTRAIQLIDPLLAGLNELTAEPERFKEFNPENGWGDYELLVRFTEEYLRACQKWPEAEVRVSR